uniref:sulfite exporter TauE/SafE family protein n=1 Tax=Rhabdothermincola sp. TaxID=2820405 RepID=UPI002FE2C380
LVGSGAGFLAGLLGVGGGIVLMPAFTVVLRIPIKEAVASSLVAVAIFSVPALVTHVALGHVNWWYALLLMAGGAPGAQIGSHLTLGASDRTVRLVFGAFMVVVAAIYGSAELLAL